MQSLGLFIQFLQKPVIIISINVDFSIAPDNKITTF